MVDAEQIGWLTARLRPYRGAMLFVAAGGLLAALLAVLAAWIVGDALDEAVNSHVGIRPLVILSAVLLGSQVVRAALLYLRQTTSIRVGTRLERDLRHELVTRVLKEAVPGRADRLLAALISDVRALRYMITPGVDIGISVSAFVVVVVGCAVVWSPQLVVAPLLYAVGFCWFCARLLRGISRAARTARDRSAGVVELVGEALHNIEAVRDAGGAVAVWDGLRSAATAHRDAVVAQGREERRTPLFLLLGLVQGIGFAHALLLARDGQMTAGDMVGYHSLLLLLGAPTFSSGAAFPALANGLAAIARIREMFPEPGPQGGGTFRPSADPLSIEVVGAVPAAGRQLPPKIELTLPACSLAVVTGPTGSGKSTLLRLLAGTETPDSGSVRIGGGDATEWRRAELAGRVVLVADHGSLFSMSLLENVGLGRLAATPDEIRATGAKAGVAEFAELMPDGWESVLGAGGAVLSGGQKQRVALARALLSHADVLLLDDPFSALDASVARHLATGLIEVARHRTVVVVTDRADLRAAATHVVRLSEAELTVEVKRTGGT
ncbi:ABC transporter ATP-binding protein [Streptomyces sp. NBC_01408]|uniref:ATP-binding cassette domain-containing protein n=1 Tax=Streptomyces sp. NBC_01408 TaxID=2903855 RepID=UPI00225AEEE2|nr:ABC transporter ATP-binding protein [Streptomyces sp. NBC_01408]MCX4692889.1 ABC transporter ATP-binding protein/permease [Streptomyces sp. NBC_01408]